jgi:hypothetical protein
MDQKTSIWRPAELHCKRGRDFSDSFRSRILGSPHSPGPTPMLVSALTHRNYRIADL